MNEDLMGAGCAVLIVLAIVGFFGLALFSHWETSEDNVSGIVYNTKNNALISHNTRFSVRASVDTYTNERNESSYCLPPNSPYKDLVNKAAADKTVKVDVKTKKGFWLRAPWACINNITVTEVKNS